MESRVSSESRRWVMPISFKNALVLLFAVVLASCQHSTSNTQTASIDAVAQAKLPQIEEPAPPKLSGECVTHSAARQYESKAAEYHDYLAYIEAVERGWRRLEVVSVGFDRSTQKHRASEISIAEVRADRIVDTNGDHWLALSSWNCTPPAANYYIDQNFTVFTLVPDLKCELKQISGCGVFPRYGCGHDSPVEWQHYARVPRQAVQGDLRTIEVRPQVCIEISPQDGYGEPPP